MGILTARERRAIRLRRALALGLCLLLALVLLPGRAAADGADAGEVVRVGWYESAFNRTDRHARRSGYAYEFQRKIAAYTGWRYEYVSGSWPELMEMLRAGEIDLMSDVSYTPERAEKMLFSSLPMGTEAYYVFTAPGNTEIRSEEPATLDGKTVGVNRGSFQKDLFLEWAEKHDVRVELVEMEESEAEALMMLQSGRLDAYVTLDAFGSPETTAPLWKIGSSDFYFAVRNGRPDLLAALDDALNRIQDENLYYEMELYEKYFHTTGSSRYLSDSERDWLAGHGAIRVGYQDNYLAFCAADPETGELTGALKDYLAYAATGFENATLSFTPIAYPSAGAAMDALRAGAVDCVFPANLTDYDAESLDLVMTPALMRTEMDAVVRSATQKEFVRKENVVVAVNQGNTNYELWLSDHYPTWKRAYFPDTPAGLDGVADGKADCVIISNYRFSNIAKQCEKLHLTTVYTGVDMDYCFAVRTGDSELYSILAKTTGVVPDSTIHTALTYYSTEDVKTSFGDLIRDNLFLVMSAIAVILLVILILLLRSIRAERKAREEEHLVKALNRQVYVDALTSVRNKGAYTDYLAELQEALDAGETVKFGIGIFDCDNLKKINDGYGHDKGDIYIKTASALICRVFQHSPVFRIGGDEFAVVLLNEDFRNREMLAEEFEAYKKALCEAAEHIWEEPRVSMGMAVYDPETDEYASDVMRRADKAMYENKQLGKSAGT